MTNKEIIDKLIDLCKYAISELREWNPESEAAHEIESELECILNRHI